MGQTSQTRHTDSLTTREVADELGISRKKVLRLKDRGVLHPLPISKGGWLRFEREEVERFKRGVAIGRSQQRWLRPALLASLYDGYAWEYNEVYIRDGRIIDRGINVRITETTQSDIDSEYLSKGFDAVVEHAEYVYLKPLDLETGKPIIDVKVPVLHLKFKVLNLEMPKFVHVFYTIDFPASPRTPVLLPVKLLGLGKE